MKFKKGKDARIKGKKGGKTTHKRYGKEFMTFLANKRWYGDKVALQKYASGNKVKEAK